MKTADQLKDEMCEVFDALKSGDLTSKVADSMTRSTNAQIALMKLQLEYSLRRNEKPEIKSLNGHPTPTA